MCKVLRTTSSVNVICLHYVAFHYHKLILHFGISYTGKCHYYYVLLQIRYTGGILHRYLLVISITIYSCDLKPVHCVCNMVNWKGMQCTSKHLYVFEITSQHEVMQGTVVKKLPPHALKVWVRARMNGANPPVISSINEIKLIQKSFHHHWIHHISKSIRGNWQFANMNYGVVA